MDWQPDDQQSDDRQLELGIVIPKPKIILPPVKVRVILGAWILDRKVKDPIWPWPSRIDLSTLDLSDPTQGVLGQLYDHHQAGCIELGISNYQAVRFGFQILDPSSPEAVKEFDDLTRAWRGYLRQWSSRQRVR